VRIYNRHFKWAIYRIQLNIDDFGVNLDIIVANNPQIYCKK